MFPFDPEDISDSDDSDGDYVTENEDSPTNG